ncbi:MAG: phosphopantothenate/pantothenate synthetase family protein, partial [Thermoplasmatales archaeon]|nr:phosphopantothenate/pantothenate synthetase family protein [Thermoplasmatales archaeon]
MIPKSHPRYESLMIREKLVQGFRDGFVVPEGLIAHGRGEAFDYLIDEKTMPASEKAEKTAAAYLLKAKKPVISVNGNTAALVRDDIINLSKIVPAKIEINLFYRTDE